AYDTFNPAGQRLIDSRLLNVVLVLMLTTSILGAPVAYEPLPTLNASVILQPQYFQGPNFTVRNPVPTYSGSNHYTIDSDFGVFEADGNAILMRRVAEINAIAKLQAMSQTKEFTQAAEQAAAAPLNVAQDLVTNPVSTIPSVPGGIWGFLNRAGEAVKEAAEGQQSTAAEGNVVENMTGFSKIKRDLAIKLGVDPYTTNEVFQKELNKVAWPAFLGKFTVDLGMAAVGGPALSAVNWTSTLTDALRDKSPTELRLMNLGLLMNNMGVSRCFPEQQRYFAHHPDDPGRSPRAARQHPRPGGIHPSGRDQPGRTRRHRLPAELPVDGQSEQQHAGRPHHPSQRPHRLPTNNGTVVVPIQWDYAAWTPMTSVSSPRSRPRNSPPRFPATP
ncbi:MAG: hypothetical protein WB586_28345, partial [Chthoniobacterales bacterium]